MDVATETQKLIDLNQQLLLAIAECDWDSYVEMCDPSLTAFEPEANSHQIHGLEFHRFYFENLTYRQATNTTMADVHVRFIGDTDQPVAAVVSYTRLVQRLEEANLPATSSFQETRVWELKDGQWQHVHFHRS